MPLFNDPTQQIITSATQPTNPTQGLIWNELNTNGNLVETWTRINNLWMSRIKEITVTFTTNVSANYYFPLDNTKDIYFHSVSRFFQSNGLTNNTNLLGVVIAAYFDATAIISPPNNLVQLSFSNQTSGQVITTTSILNKSFVGFNVNNLQIIVTRSGNPPTCNFGFDIRYQYIRK